MTTLTILGIACLFVAAVAILMAALRGALAPRCKECGGELVIENDKLVCSKCGKPWRDEEGGE